MAIDKDHDNSKKENSDDPRVYSVEESSEESFPASDSPAWPTPRDEMKVTSDIKPTSSQNRVRSVDSLKTRTSFTIQGKTYDYYSLQRAKEAGLKEVDRLPFTLKILLENLLRHEDQQSVTLEDIHAVVEWLETKKSHREIAFRPTRVLMQDFTGVPAVVDLAAMRDAIEALGSNAEHINPLSAVDLVIDHSIQVDEFLTQSAFGVNAKMEMQRNYERYAFLRWGQKAFENFRVVPPDTGICHQVNLEYLAKVVWHHQETSEVALAYPDTLVGTDSHTTMINGLGVLGWGVGGIEAEAAMLGQPISMLIPQVIGVKLTGQLTEGVTATDLVLAITHRLREHGVVGKFVEYFGPGLLHLSVADRATIANMSPEYGATCGFFPIDEATLTYLRLTGRSEETVALIEAYAKAQKLWHDPNHAPEFTEVLSVDLSKIEPSMAGPKRPQDQVDLASLKATFDKLLIDENHSQLLDQNYATSEGYDLHHGDVVIAAITSCTNTSNPNVLIAAGLVAKRAYERGLKRKPWVKTSFAPGSQVVTQYLEKAGLQTYLDHLGFSLVGYGCTTCIGNSGPLIDAVAECVNANDLTVSAVLSGNRNFEGRIHPQVKANWLASPPLVVLFALIGTVRINLLTDVLGYDQKNEPVYLKDLWPTNAEISQEASVISDAMFKSTYQNVFKGDTQWRAMQVPQSQTYDWQADSTYIQLPPFFANMSRHPTPIQTIKQARVLAMLGDSVTTDHISPAGSIKADSPAGRYLASKGVASQDFNSLGSRRGNHEVMMRGTFANIRIRNEMVPGQEGGITKLLPSNEVMSIFDAAMRYQEDGTPLVVIAGREYGTGSSRDWAAKGPKLLGVVVVIAESFERIHRSNLIGMGILPLQFLPDVTRQSLGLTGTERFDFLEVETQLQEPSSLVTARIYFEEGREEVIQFQSRIDTLNELAYYRHGGILPYVLRNMLSVEA
ncbi:MAG: aconitate hydratase AcnA [Gammaproteobacteria bacterium]|nr:aconitate hydratase AcnA [Gammaproteobacteria bacterium]